MMEEDETLRDGVDLNRSNGKSGSANATKPSKEAKQTKSASVAKEKKNADKGKKTAGKKKVRQAEKGEQERRRRVPTFPASSFEQVLELAREIQTFSGGVKVRRDTLFEQHLKRSPDSGPTRQLITNSSRYGLTIGGYQADYLELTPDGATVVSPDTSEAEKVRAKFRLAIEGIPPFKLLYEQFLGKRLPALAVLMDTLKEHGISDDEVREGAETFVVNAKYVGILRESGGAERVVSIDQVITDLPRPISSSGGTGTNASLATEQGKPAGKSDWDKTCFYITAIGEDGSEQRQHSDMFLGAIVEPALESLGFTVVRADAIEKPGMITSQVIEHILRCKMVVADLSFHNPNAFYELCLRHATRLPVVQIIRKGDRIPFDINQFRTVVIDESNKYTIVSKLEVYRADVASQVRHALDDPESAANNPLITFAPSINLLYDGKPS